MNDDAKLRRIEHLSTIMMYASFVGVIALCVLLYSQPQIKSISAGLIIWALILCPVILWMYYQVRTAWIRDSAANIVRIIPPVLLITAYAMFFAHGPQIKQIISDYRKPSNQAPAPSGFATRMYNYGPIFEIYKEISIEIQPETPPVGRRVRCRALLTPIDNLAEYRHEHMQHLGRNSLIGDTIIFMVSFNDTQAVIIDDWDTTIFRPNILAGRDRIGYYHPVQIDSAPQELIFHARFRKSGTYVIEYRFASWPTSYLPDGKPDTNKLAGVICRYTGRGWWLLGTDEYLFNRSVTAK